MNISGLSLHISDHSDHVQEIQTSKLMRGLYIRKCDLIGKRNLFI
jgi:hypothetical protein